MTSSRTKRRSSSTKRAVGSAMALGGVALVALMIAACGGDGPERPPVETGNGETSSGKLRVYVVNYPLMYFAERIGGEHVDVVFPAPADVDPAYWQPEVNVIAEYQAADLIVKNGAGYANWMTMATLPDSKIVYSAEGFFEDVIVEESAVTHSHGPEGEHSHGETAFTTWLDPLQAIMQAESIAAALTEARPDAAADFEAGMVSLRAELEELDARLARAADQIGEHPILASHPVYQYLARRYGLNIRSVHFEPDENPSEEAWDDLARLYAEHAATTMLWEAQPLAETSARLAEMGIEVVVFDPAANRPAGGDFMDAMRSNATNLEEDRS